MAKGAMNVAKGVAVGMIAGATASMVGKKMMEKKSSLDDILYVRKMKWFIVFQNLETI